MRTVYAQLEEGLGKLQSLYHDYSRLNALLESVISSMKNGGKDASIRLNRMRDNADSNLLIKIIEDDWTLYRQDSHRDISSMHHRWQTESGDIDITEILERLFEEIFQWAEACVLLNFEMSRVSDEEKDVLQRIVYVGGRYHEPSLGSSSVCSGNFRKR